MIYHPRGRVALQYPLISSDGIKLVFVRNYFYTIHKADLSISSVYVLFLNRGKDMEASWTLGSKVTLWTNISRMSNQMHRRQKSGENMAKINYA
jgi:hypothetical protein